MLVEPQPEAEVQHLQASEAQLQEQVGRLQQIFQATKEFAQANLLGAGKPRAGRNDRASDFSAG